jgi:hypothetical protein
MSPQHPPLVGLARAQSLPIAENSIVRQWQLLAAGNWLTTGYKRDFTYP